MKHPARIALTLAVLIIGTVYASPAAAATKDTGIHHTPFGKTNKVSAPRMEPV